MEPSNNNGDRQLGGMVHKTLQWINVGGVVILFATLAQCTKDSNQERDRLRERLQTLESRSEMAANTDIRQHEELLAAQALGRAERTRLEERLNKIEDRQNDVVRRLSVIEARERR